MWALSSSRQADDKAKGSTVADEKNFYLAWEPELSSASYPEGVKRASELLQKELLEQTPPSRTPTILRKVTVDSKSRTEKRR